MEFEDTPLWTETQKVLRSGPTSTNYTWEVIIHTPQEDITALNLSSVNFVRSYTDAFGDEITITTLFGLGTFAHRILPFREKLEVTLKKIPTLEYYAQQEPTTKIEAERFSAILVGDVGSPSLGQGREAKDEDSLNLNSLLDVHFQLQDKACEQLRVLMAGGAGRKTTVQNFLTTVIATQTANIKVDGDRALKGVDMIAADNKDLKEQIVVTQGIRLVDLADFVQKRIGIYNAGLGSYIQNGYWYIFPLYDTSDYHRRVKTLTMLVVPENKLSQVERTYYSEANSTTIIVTGKTAFRDDAGSNYQNYGNGARFAHAGKMLDSNQDTNDNKTKLHRGKNNGKFVTDDASLKFAPVASNRITANPFAILSMQASKRGGLFRAIWQNSDHSLIYPGMVVKMVYSEADQLREDYGIVHAVTHVSHKPGHVNGTQFINQTVVDVFINNQIKPVDD